MWEDRFPSYRLSRDAICCITSCLLPGSPRRAAGRRRVVLCADHYDQFYKELKETTNSLAFLSLILPLLEEGAPLEDKSSLEGVINNE